ncbi:LytTR family DNA-binding domain-containing protein [Aquimarina gracilis]|uniref:LytTR family DNA-binding domain-containing protein n=1 Tax=Aquimarina gracilis TaxID=874422 RepID=A0ABU5ZYA3_9FLAO|nr:LytTR family DNA-binding domain-containing protein [Aquimarina gracilis]MEB3346832.1 LytTR family DNA-binding domain-containing protein [Aquimarina gracilis]
MNINAVLIEDEAAARDHFLKLITKIDNNINICKQIATVIEAVEWFSTHRDVDLIFMDIQLSDGISFDILERVEIDIPIIFITAYDQYALKAFKTSGIDYLLKPISIEDLEGALEKFYKTNKNIEWAIRNIDIAQLIKRHEKQNFKELFLVKSGNSMIPVKTNEIAYFYRDRLIFAKSFTGESYLLDHSLNQLQTMLDQEKFIRLNRQLLVNLDAIHKLATHKPGQLSVILTPDYSAEIVLSHERSKWLKLFFERK